MKNMMIGLVLLGALSSVGCGSSKGCDSCEGSAKDACETARELCEDFEGCDLDEFDDEVECE